MKRSSLLAIAAVALAAVTLAPASTATAAPGGKGTKAGSPVVKADKRLATEQRKVTSSIATKDAALRRVKVAQLPVGATEVAANIAADRVALGELKDAALVATTVTDVHLVGTQVNAVRPEVYAVVVNGLRQAVRFEQVAADNTVAVTDLAAQADAKELEGFDVTGVRELLGSATLANDGGRRPRPRDRRAGPGPDRLQPARGQGRLRRGRRGRRRAARLRRGAAAGGVRRPGRHGPADRRRRDPGCLTPLTPCERAAHAAARSPYPDTPA